MKKVMFGLVTIVFAFQLAVAENTTLYSGRASTKSTYIGAALGDDILDFLQIQFDVLKYLKDDPALHNADPKLSRGDLLAVSLNCVLKLPLHLIPSMDSLDYIQPYISVGRGYAAESLSVDYYDTPNAGNGKNGIFNKIRSFSSFGCGLIVMVTPSFGLKVDYRAMKLSELSGLGPEGAARTINRLSIGVCFGAYKRAVNKPKKTGGLP